MRKRARGQKNKKKGMYNGAIGVAALVLFVYAASVAPPRELVARAPLMLGSAAIGVAASVPENPYNSLAQELRVKEEELKVREQQLSGNGGNTLPQSGFFNLTMALVSFALSIILFVLLLLNFYFDWHRERMRTLRTT